MQNDRKLEFIQALRGIAALMVVLAHTRIFFVGVAGKEETINRMFWGGGGVDLFFIISGFIMVYTTRNSDASLKYLQHFAVKRFTRIWPAYFLATVAWVFVGHSGFSYFASSVDHFLKSIFFLPIQASDPMYLGRNITLPVGWTLNYEVYFYIVFGVSMLFGRLRWIALGATMIAMLVCLPALTGTLSLDPLQPSPFHSAYIALVTNPIIWDFLAGVCIGLIYLSRVRVRESILWLLLFATCALYAWGLMTNTGANDGIARWGGFASIVFFCLAFLSKRRELKVPKVLSALGDVSYTLYLTHEFALTAVTSIVKQAGYSAFVGTYAHVLLVTAASVLLAFVASPFIEKMPHDLINRRRSGDALHR